MKWLMLIKLLTQCLAPQVLLRCLLLLFPLLSDRFSQMFVSLFPQLSGIFILESVDHLLSAFKMVSLERMQKCGLCELCFSEIASEFKMKEYFFGIYLYFSYSFGIDR